MVEMGGGSSLENLTRIPQQSGSQINQIPNKYSQAESTKFLILTVVSILCIVGVLLASTVVYCLRHRSHHKLKEKLTNLGTDTSSDATATYQELCRQRMAVKPPAERPEPISSRINSVSSQFSDGGQALSPSARSSVSSWCEEPVHSNLDISTGHMILLPARCDGTDSLMCSIGTEMLITPEICAQEKSSPFAAGATAEKKRHCCLTRTLDPSKAASLERREEGDGELLLFSGGFRLCVGHSLSPPAHKPPTRLFTKASFDSPPRSSSPNSIFGAAGFEICTDERLNLRRRKLLKKQTELRRGPSGQRGIEPVSLGTDSAHVRFHSYMEDHLKNKDRLEKEWEALCAYQAEPNACTAGLKDGNAKKNRSAAVVAYDHSRITLKVENSQGNSDYINASPIMDHDPRNPAYIATQGPLPSTVADFWQMVWENGCVVIVMLTPLVEGGVKQCYHYWPDEGSNLYHIYEVNLVSEHIWCDDFLVRSFYLKNMQTNETRTVTQFHFLTWLNQNVPETSRTLLDFRRKVNKCYRGRSCPIIVHCSDGAGRSGTYTLIDMVLNKMAKGAKEIDIAATLEHLRDQRPGMVQTKDQFEFALTAVAEEVNAILKALPQ
ncbi:unnamed protein product [Pleuronectes platessa]|uniref:Receptor-type tyrosine-protein phosphatase N2 n=1 Tax=Pleuronectes platessa TaxID=8262 RepID=A0A9N7VNA9_PLEPL|nr:unnamed protein product [Pleuronectes platessa]